ncbi:lysis protein [Xenorhabdus bovienii]|uniref:lysis protein n=1 Tax=Xenorhabdus bovienii TaxID=40576 RepID=UPI0030B9DB4C
MRYRHEIQQPVLHGGCSGDCLRSALVLLQFIAINEQQARIQHLAELDSKHRQELDNAKSKIDTLRADVAAGRRKLRIKAICPVLETTSSGSMGYAGTPQLTDAARQDYYDLLRMMAENERQTKYLQDYVNTECRGNDGKHR